jgi:hypothetical protein
LPILRCPETGERLIQAAATFGDAPMKDFVEFWRNPRSCDTSVVWHLFFRLPRNVQSRIAAGFEALGRKRSA